MNWHFDHCHSLVGAYITRECRDNCSNCEIFEALFKTQVEEKFYDDEVFLVFFHKLLFFRHVMIFLSGDSRFQDSSSLWTLDSGPGTGIFRRTSAAGCWTPNVTKIQNLYLY